MVECGEPELTPKVLRPYGPVAHGHPSRLVRWTRLGDSKIRVYFKSVLPKFAAVEAVVEESNQAVTITLVVGRRAVFAEAKVISPAVLDSVDITLSHPLGSRVVVDTGAL